MPPILRDQIVMNFQSGLGWVLLERTQILSGNQFTRHFTNFVVVETKPFFDSFFFSEKVITLTKGIVPLIVPVLPITPLPLQTQVCTLYIACHTSSTTHASQPTYTNNELRGKKKERKKNQTNTILSSLLAYAYTTQNNIHVSNVHFGSAFGPGASLLPCTPLVCVLNGLGDKQSGGFTNKQTNNQQQSKRDPNTANLRPALE